jgi:hypothetical protein
MRYTTRTRRGPKAPLKVKDGYQTPRTWGIAGTPSDVISTWPVIRFRRSSLRVRFDSVQRLIDIATIRHHGERKWTVSLA